MVDLSCTCISSDTACSLFNICFGIFLEQTTDVGRIVALDEAHKFSSFYARYSFLLKIYSTWTILLKHALLLKLLSLP